MGKVKLIWVFSGPNAEDLAKAKEVLLEQLGEEEGIEFYSGTEYVSHISWVTYFIVSEEDKANYFSELDPIRVEEYDS